jgi:quinol monooxygenase YgiN
MENTIIEFIFSYKIKAGKEERFKEVIKSHIDNTERLDKGILRYSVFKKSDNEYSQYELYKNEQALLDHMKNTAEGLKEWGEITEITSMTVHGNVPESIIEMFKLRENVYTSYLNFER